MQLLSHFFQKTGLVLVLCTFWQIPIHASPVYKCVADGRVSFQSIPCASDKPSRQPTVDELNAERKKRLTAAQAAAAVPAASAVPNGLTVAPGARPEPRPAGTAGKTDDFRCDGRLHCSQMRSCREAKYFLANCPGVKMDGDRDGVPCEMQWCTHPFAE